MPRKPKALTATPATPGGRVSRKVSLTDEVLKTIRPTGKRFRLTDTVVRGLSVDVGTTGSITWQFRAPMKVGHRQEWVSIGAWPGVSFEAARAEAQRIRTNLTTEVDLRKAKKAARKSGTIEFLTGRWLIEYVKKELRPGTYRSYLEKVNLYILPAFATKLPRDITPAMIAAWHQKITEMGVAAFRTEEEEEPPSGPKVGRRKRRKGRPAATAADGANAVFSAFFKWAVADGKADFNPTLGGKKNGGREIHRPMDSQARKKVGSTLMGMEANREANVIYLEAVRLAMVTGIRRDSIAALEWCDLDLENGVATLNDKSSRTRGPQSYPLGSAAISILQGIPHIADSPFVFPGRDPMQHVSTGTLNRIWSQVRENAGVCASKPEKDRYGERIEKPTIRFHDLRHGKGAALGKKNKNAMVAAVIGLSTQKMADRYGRPVDEEAAKANEVFERELASDLGIPWPTRRRNKAKKEAEVNAPAPAQIVIQVTSWPPRKPRAKKPAVKKESKPRPTQIEWPSDEDLQRLVLEKPMVELADQLGVSDRAITKRCDRLGLERRPQGYWLKQNADD
jgi:integrase